MTLQNRLVGLLTAFVILPMLASLGVGYVVLQVRLEGFVVERLQGATQQKVKAVEDYFATVQADLEVMKNSPSLQASFKDLYKLGYEKNSGQYAAIVDRLDQEITPIRLTSGYADIKYVLDDKRDQVVYVNNSAYSDELGLAENTVLDLAVQEGGAGTAYSEVFGAPGTSPQKYGMYVATRIADQDKLTIGVLVVMLDLSPVYDDVTNTLGLSTSGESFLLKDDGYSALYLTPLKYDQAAALIRRENYGDSTKVIAEEAARGRTGNGIGTDYRGKKVIAAWAPVSGLPWSVESKIDLEEALSVARNMQSLALIATIAILLAVISIVWVTIARLVERPLRSLQRVAEELSNGHYDARVDDQMLYQSDEFGKLATFLHHISHRLKYEASGRKDQHQASNEHPPHANHLHQ